MGFWKCTAACAGALIGCVSISALGEMPDAGEIPELAIASVLADAPEHAVSARFPDVPEIADSALHDIAILKPDPEHGVVILYNPWICQLVGPACGFFLTHEHGHVAHEHQPRQSVTQLAAMEAQADCWAAANGNPQEVVAAYHLFMNGGSSPNWNIYGHPAQRAARVRECAMNADNWIGY